MHPQPILSQQITRKRKKNKKKTQDETSEILTVNSEQCNLHLDSTSFRKLKTNIEKVNYNKKDKLTTGKTELQHTYSSFPFHKLHECI